MAEHKKIDWIGLSGTKYTHFIHEIPTNIKDGELGNYIYTKLVNNKWIPIYIGQGDLGDRTDIDQHHQSKCLKNKGATHVHMHLNPKEADRLAEEKDLLGNYTNAYQPTGCNEKPGG